MKEHHTNPVPRALSLALASIFALALAACGDKPAEVVVKPAAQPAPKAAPSPPKADAKADQTKQETAAKAAAEKAKQDADAALAAKVKSALGAEKGLNAHAIDITAKDGAVTLFGTADTPALRDKATKIAAGVEGVKSVENRMAVVKGS